MKQKQRVEAEIVEKEANEFLETSRNGLKMWNTDKESSDEKIEFRR